MNSKTVIICLVLLVSGAVAFDLGVRGLHRHPQQPRWPLGTADARLGRIALRHYGCGACHVIPGVPGAIGRVGPRLDGYVHQMYVAGILANTPENLVDWIRRPRDHNPKSAMPNLGVEEQEAWNMVAYLYSLR